MRHKLSKSCAVCGREITWRKKWERSWDAVKYCSDACRRRRSDIADQGRIEGALLAKLAHRAPGVTICPSEVARDLWPDEWQDQMEAVREAARRLVARGQLEILQRGRVVDPSRSRGPIRLRHTRSPSGDS